MPILWSVQPLLSTKKEIFLFVFKVHLFICMEIEILITILFFSSICRPLPTSFPAPPEVGQRTEEGVQRTPSFLSCYLAICEQIVFGHFGFTITSGKCCSRNGVFSHWLMLLWTWLDVIVFLKSAPHVWMLYLFFFPTLKISDIQHVFYFYVVLFIACWRLVQHSLMLRYVISMRYLLLNSLWIRYF